jgi:hypothetical protein
MSLSCDSFVLTRTAGFGALYACSIARLTVAWSNAAPWRTLLSDSSPLGTVDGSNDKIWHFQDHFEFRQFSSRFLGDRCRDCEKVGTDGERCVEFRPFAWSRTRPTSFSRTA